MVGIVHPCKVYGAMAVSRPILFLGPKPSHVSDLIEFYRIGWHIQHGDRESAARVLQELSKASPEELSAMGRRAREAISSDLSRGVLLSRFCDVMQRGLPRLTENESV